MHLEILLEPVKQMSYLQEPHLVAIVSYLKVIIYATYHCQIDIRKQNVNFSILIIKVPSFLSAIFFLIFIKTYCCSNFYYSY